MDQSNESDDSLKDYFTIALNEAITKNKTECEHYNETFLG